MMTTESTAPPSVSLQTVRSAREFSVGICATGRVTGFASLIRKVLAAGDGANLVLKKVVIVASDCAEDSLEEMRAWAGQDRRIEIVEEPVRRGKADAINKILRRAEGDYIVFVNSDASPEGRAIERLVTIIASDPSIGGVSANPVPEARNGITSRLLDLMWTAHNESALTLNHMNLANHSSDELVTFRISAVSQLPVGLVNDGAFLAGTARKKGYTIKFCSDANVRVETPSRLVDAIRQRRRILFGHAEVWRRTGSPPRTIESLMVLRPSTGFRLLVRTIARNPRFLAVIPLAAVTEVAAALLSTWDSIMSTDRHVVWKRYN
jgi:cellulose synthase/poly-beta-1,6-N-acetylglucosamine synthase-like glycosyltransferase